MSRTEQVRFILSGLHILSRHYLFLLTKIIFGYVLSPRYRRTPSAVVVTPCRGTLVLVYHGSVLMGCTVKLGCLDYWITGSDLRVVQLGEDLTFETL